ncbi:hypothetical protein HQ544_03355 [Candidatus Falkowbacteria bacterium]|nr:hypothetical protein [Candidatus Falkowbacteria bacterium]
MKLKSKVFIFLLVAVVLAPSVRAEGFNKDYIISDDQMTDYESMGMFDIIDFIKDKGGSLYGSKFMDLDGREKSASALIYNASQTYKINPKVLLVTLQKEQSLVENPNPSQYNYDWATGWAVCDGCNLSDPKVSKYKGFASQIDGAAGGYDWYIDQFTAKKNTWLIWPDKATTIDGETVVPANMATAALYNYTPHMHGNENFYNLWNEWFSLAYPDGSLLHAEGESDIWVIQGGYRKTFKSLSVLQSRYDYSNVMTVPKGEIEKYLIGPEIKFSNYSLLRTPNGAVYLLVDDEKRWITSMEVFRTLGFNIQEVEEVEASDLTDYTKGEDITLENAYPTGGLLRDNVSGAIYWVKDGEKRLITDWSVININFKGYVATNVTGGELEKYTTGSSVKIKDGTLIKSPAKSSVYVISEGKRRPIESGKTFIEMGYKWENIKVVPQHVVNLHPEGELVVISF